MALKKGDLWPGYRSVNIPMERKYHLVYALPYGQYRPAIQFVDYAQGIVYEEVYTTEPWEKLVEDINEIAVKHTGQKGGIFYVNEYRQVIKPIGDSSGTVDIYVGEYLDLQFVFDCNGRLIDNADVSGLDVGDSWPHQKVGTQYHYSAYQGDIYYSLLDGNVIRRYPIKAPTELAHSLWSVKGGQGGIFYVNEHCHAFAPQGDSVGPDIFVGTIDQSQWFPKCTG